MANKFREKPVAEEPAKRPVAQEPAAGKAVAEEAVETVEAEESPAPKQVSAKGGKAARGLGRVLGGDMLADKLVLRQIPLVLLCLVYLLLIVGNRYRVESLSREKIATEERINDLREERIQMQKQYQKSVKISQIAEDLAETGVGITNGPPYEI